MDIREKKKEMKRIVAGKGILTNGEHFPWTWFSLRFNDKQRDFIKLWKVKESGKIMREVAQMVECACNAGEADSTPGLGRTSGGRNGYMLQYSC